jgi:hypothetical protein
MSTSKVDSVDAFRSVGTISEKTKLTLAASQFKLRKNGIEFRSAQAIPIWTEMRVDLQSPWDNRRVQCTGVVVACRGNRHAGHHVSMVLMNLTRQSQAQLSLLHSRLA